MLSKFGDISSLLLSNLSKAQERLRRFEFNVDYLLEY